MIAPINKSSLFHFLFKWMDRVLWAVHCYYSKMTAQLFRAHGKFCASHPWEVIVALLTLTACMLTVDRSKQPASTRLRNCQGWRESCDGLEAEYVAVDTILMTVVRCSAILYSYYQFLYLNKFGSKYILGEYRVCATWCIPCRIYIYGKRLLINACMRKPVFFVSKR